MLEAQAENLWSAHYEMTLPGGVPFPARMTVVRLGDGSLALISPVPIDNALATELAALGPVSHLIAPNLFHHLYLAAAKVRYPQARVVGPAGLAAKEPGLTFASPGADHGAPFQAALAATTVEGAPRAAETAWLHIPSRTLVAADLVFNVETAPSWKTSVTLQIMGTRGRLAQSRLWSFLVTDKTSARESCRRILALDFDRLIVAHGSVIASGAKERLAAAMTRTC